MSETKKFMPMDSIPSQLKSFLPPDSEEEYDRYMPVLVLICAKGEGEKVQVAVEGPLPFNAMMVMAEYMTHLCAQHSNAGYEKALDLIREGAMTYRKPKGSSEN